MKTFTWKKRVALTALAATGGAGAGWLYANVLTSCGGTCLVGAHPIVVTVALAGVAAYAAIVATRQRA